MTFQRSSKSLVDNRGVGNMRGEVFKWERTGSVRVTIREMKSCHGPKAEFKSKKSS